MNCKGQIEGALTGQQVLNGEVTSSARIGGRISSERAISGKLTAVNDLKGSLSSTDSIEGALTAGLIQGGSYERLKKKPKINSVELIGNKTGKQLSLIDSEDLILEYEIDQIIFGGLG